MFCARCSNEIPDESKFCPRCSSPTGGAPDADAGTPPAGAGSAAPVVEGAPDASRKRSRKPLLIGVAAALAAVAVGIFGMGALGGKTLEGTWDISITGTTGAENGSYSYDLTLKVGSGSWELTTSDEDACIALMGGPSASVSSGVVDGSIAMVYTILSGTYEENVSGNFLEYDVRETDSNLDFKVKVPRDGVGSEFPVGEWVISDFLVDGEESIIEAYEATIEAGGSFAFSCTEDPERTDYPEETSVEGTWEPSGDAAIFTIAEADAKMVISLKGA